MSKQIIIIKPGSLSSKDKEKLTKEGNVVIEHEKSHEINYRQSDEHLPHVYTNCVTCGERIYMLKERMNALKYNKKTFFCSQGHSQAFI